MIGLSVSIAENYRVALYFFRFFSRGEYRKMNIPMWEAPNRKLALYWTTLYSVTAFPVQFCGLFILFMRNNLRLLFWIFSSRMIVTTDIWLS